MFDDDDLDLNLPDATFADVAEFGAFHDSEFKDCPVYGHITIALPNGEYATLFLRSRMRQGIDIMAKTDPKKASFVLGEMKEEDEEIEKIFKEYGFFPVN